jgi:hypothetical protein
VPCADSEYKLFTYVRSHMSRVKEGGTWEELEWDCDRMCGQLATNSMRVADI